MRQICRFTSVRGRFVPRSDAPARAKDEGTMSTPLTFIAEQLALREDLARRVEMMKNHLAVPQRDPHFGIGVNYEDITPEAIERLEGQIADIDARVERFREGNI